MIEGGAFSLYWAFSWTKTCTVHFSRKERFEMCLPAASLFGLKAKRNMCAFAIIIDHLNSVQYVHTGLYVVDEVQSAESDCERLAGSLKSVWYSCSHFKMQTTFAEPIIISLSLEYNTGHPKVNTYTFSLTSRQISHDPLEPEIAFWNEKACFRLYS